MQGQFSRAQHSRLYIFPLDILNWLSSYCIKFSSTCIQSPIKPVNITANTLGPLKRPTSISPHPLAQSSRPNHAPLPAAPGGDSRPREGHARLLSPLLEYLQPYVSTRVLQRVGVFLHHVFMWVLRVWIFLHNVSEPIRKLVRSYVNESLSELMNLQTLCEWVL